MKTTKHNRHAIGRAAPEAPEEPLAARLRTFLYDKNLTFAKFGILAGVSVTVVWRAMHGIPLKPRSLYKIERLLKATRAA